MTRNRLLIALILLALFFDTKVFGPQFRILFSVVRGLVALFAIYQFRNLLIRPLKGSPDLTLLLPPPPTRTLKATTWASLGYLTMTGILFFPLVTEFQTHYFADQGDGAQMYWNFWWLHYSITHFQNPFFTDYLHFPLGSTLLGASYHPLKSLVFAPLISLWGLAPAFNVMVLSTFFLCALTSFLLCYRLTGSFLGSFIGGALFGFGNNRFAHGNGHLHVMSAELLPLFILIAAQWCDRPTKKISVALASTLFAALLIDAYGFLYSVGIFFFLVSWTSLRRKEALYFFKAERGRTSAFLATLILLTSGTFVGRMIFLSKTDPWLGTHNPVENSLDLLAPFIPGGYSWMHPWTSWFWTKTSADLNEGSVYCGLAAIALAFWIFRNRKKTSSPHTILWIACLSLIAFILSLGPYLQIWGYQTPFTLPYKFLHQALPFMRMTGMPIRIFALSTLGISVLVAFALARIRKSAPLLASGLACLMAIEMYPRMFNRTARYEPPFISYLRNLPGKPAVIDAVSSKAQALYFQTIHEKPLAFGYIARVPQSRVLQENEIREQLLQKNFTALRNRGFEYLVLSAQDKGHGPKKSPEYQDNTAIIFKLD